ncbi:DUF3515 domain-containing protein [uncultured Corynebacterium sp.]|uniref:DUF3515 domain-containing protein n=1 Tax=uncultured Corynebacterium sp. TaxID=159447 RepID=UPI00262DCD51|nr:DUF3515 domain-containing protein [uncultured Corynebacterium sp.]
MSTRHTTDEQHVSHSEFNQHNGGTTEQTGVMRRPLIVLSLVLALLLVAGVLVGSKLYLQKLNNQPVALAELPSPEADSPQCAELIDGLPDTVAGHSRATLADPAPAGAAVWQTSSAQRVTLRCGVDAPLQYTELTQTHELGGAEWIKVTDPTPGSNLTTWFTVDRSPVVAVTADDAALVNDDAPVADLNLSGLPEESVDPHRAPLADVASISNASAADAACRELMAQLPDEIAEDYSRLDVTAVHGLESNAAAWGADGKDPLVLKCGVEPPAHYEPGAQLTQVNDVPWFEDAGSDNASQSTTLYALGRTTDIAVSVPAGVGEGALTQLSELIAQHVPEQ